MTVIVVLYVLFCPPGGALACDPAEIYARDCRAAEDWARGWLPRGWELELDGCLPLAPRAMVRRP